MLSIAKRLIRNVSIVLKTYNQSFCKLTKRKFRCPNRRAGQPPKGLGGFLHRGLRCGVQTPRWFAMRGLCERGLTFPRIPRLLPCTPLSKGALNPVRGTHAISPLTNRPSFLWTRRPVTSSLAPRQCLCSRKAALFFRLKGAWVGRRSHLYKHEIEKSHRARATSTSPERERC